MQTKIGYKVFLILSNIYITCMICTFFSFEKIWLDKLQMNSWIQRTHEIPS